jgi:hypothetical protein
MIAFGLGGYLLMRLDFEPAPLLLGLVIGPMLEENLRRSFTLSGGDPRIFVERPVTAILLAIAIGVLVVSALPSIRQRRTEAFAECPRDKRTCFTSLHRADDTRRKAHPLPKPAKGRKWVRWQRRGEDRQIRNK